MAAAPAQERAMDSSAMPTGSEATLEAVEALFALLYRPGPSWILGQPITGQPLGPHRAYIEQLFAAGRVVVAGPFLDGTSGGLAVVRRADEAGRRARPGPPPGHARGA